MQYKEETRQRGGFTIIRQVPETVVAKQYIEANVGIKVEYINNIEDILKYTV